MNKAYGEPYDDVEVPPEPPSAYVVEPLALGWFCRSCDSFNGDHKEFLTKCRCCDAPRPKRPA
jgi:hypothetical protein